MIKLLFLYDDKNFLMKRKTVFVIITVCLAFGAVFGAAGQEKGYNDESMLAEAVNKFNNKDFAGAHRILGRLMEKDPENEQLQRQLQTVYMSAEQQMGEEQQNVLFQLQNVTKRVMDEFRKAKGYDVLLSAETLSSYDEKLDVTNDLLVEMNKQKVNFAPLDAPADEGPKADEPAGDKKEAAKDAAADKKDGKKDKAAE